MEAHKKPTTSDDSQRVKNALDDGAKARLDEWIFDLCNGRTSISVAHRMFAVDENITNIPLERLLYLIRNSQIVRNYVGDDESRRTEVMRYTAQCVHQLVMAKFSTAQYVGD